MDFRENQRYQKKIRMKKPFLTLALMIRKNIPNLLTLCNLLCGCIAIVLVLYRGYLEWAAIIVGIACIFDFLDGFLARALNAYSEIGKQLDSLADMVSFGVVPGVMMYYFLRASMVMSMGNPSDANAFSSNAILVFPYFGFFITIFSAIRLAKFNIDTRQSDSFIGVPTPANTIFIAFLPIALDKVKGDLLHFVLNPFFLVGIVVISSFLLVAPLPLFAQIGRAHV